MADSKNTVTYRCADCKSLSEIALKIHEDDSRYIECSCGEQCVPYMSWDEYKEAIAVELHKQAKWPMEECKEYAETFKCTYSDIISGNDMPIPADDVSEEISLMTD